MSKLPISVVINTFQAERYLDLVLRAVANHVQEIVICDMYSNDQTIPIAEKHNAKVVYTEHLGYADPARKFAVEQATQPWIFILDADEIVPATLWPEIEKVIIQSNVDIIQFHWLNYMFGKPITGAGFAPEKDIHPRLFKQGKMTLHAEVHAYRKPVPDAKIHTVPYSPETCIHHFTYRAAEEFITRVNKYTSLEAENHYKSATLRPLNALRKLSRDFIKRLYKQGGNKLGWQGFNIALLMLANDAMKFAKIIELQNQASPESTEQKHKEIAENLL
jgi:glycosyltransferase involved in cell wall biosynthesis